MSLYRFSPIKSSDELTAAILYVIEQENLLFKKLIDESLPISYLTIFAHYDDEYENLVNILKNWGDPEAANNGTKVTLNNPIIHDAQQIHEVRIRKPDPYRMQVGCCDFIVDDFYSFKDKQLNSNPNIRLIERPDYEMLEFYHPDFDVLSYVVSP